VQQCRAAGVAPFVKQLGAVVVSEDRTAPFEAMSGKREDYRDFMAPNGQVWAWRAGLKDRRHGGDIEEFPASLQVREFPVVRR
jgi:hypothetical protein